MRMLIIKQDTDLQALSGRLLTAKLSARQTDSALQSLQALNPHVDLKNVRAGTVLLVPDVPGFKTSATDVVHGAALGAFQQLVRDAVSGTAERMKAGDAGRAAERTQVSAALKAATLKRIVENDPELQKQISDVGHAFKTDQLEAEQAQQAMASVGKAAQDALTALGKVLG